MNVDETKSPQFRGSAVFGKLLKEIRNRPELFGGGCWEHAANNAIKMNAQRRKSFSTQNDERICRISLSLMCRVSS
jgi:hypothetical protein